MAAATMSRSGPDHVHGAYAAGYVSVRSSVYWPSSQRPGAISSRAWAGPHVPGA